MLWWNGLDKEYMSRLEDENDKSLSIRFRIPVQKIRKRKTDKYKKRNDDHDNGTAIGITVRKKEKKNTF